MIGLLFSLYLAVCLSAEESVDDFLRRNTPLRRSERFVNAQEYPSVEDTPSYMVSCACIFSIREKFKLTDGYQSDNWL